MPQTPEEHLSGFVVAVDGPSGSGKSSVSKQVARSLGFGFLDTGAMYRALTWWCLHEGVDLTDADAVTAAAQRFPLTIGTDPDAPAVAVDGTDVAAAIRETGISTNVSAVAAVIPRRARSSGSCSADSSRRPRGAGWRGRRGTRHHDRRRTGRARAHPAHRIRGGTTGAPLHASCTAPPTPPPWPRPGPRSSTATGPTRPCRSSPWRPTA